jgi:hypothetical protein
LVQVEQLNSYLKTLSVDARWWMYSVDKKNGS